MDFTQGLTNWFNLSIKNPVLDMAYFYSTYSYAKEKGIDYRDTRLLFYQGLDYETEKFLTEKEYAMTEERECLYSVVQSANIAPETADVEELYRKGEELGVGTEDRFYCNPMGSFFRDNSRYSYVEIYIPIK